MRDVRIEQRRLHARAAADQGDVIRIGGDGVLHPLLGAGIPRRDVAHEVHLLDVLDVHHHRDVVDRRAEGVGRV